jgi:phage FluMu protein Com
MNGGYTYTNTGGIEIKCPMCVGEGFTKSLSEAIEDVKKINTKNKKEREFQNDNKPTEKSDET